MEGDMRERHGRVLGELAEVGMAMVRRLVQATQEADDNESLMQLGLAFHRVSRSVRQTVALELRLSQEIRPEARRLTAQPFPPTLAESAPLRLRPERTGWNEYERDDSGEALEDLDVLLDADELDLEAVNEAIETSIAQIRRGLEMEAPLKRAALPTPAPCPRSRRSALLGAASFAPPPLAASKPTSSRPSLRRSSA